MKRIVQGGLDRELRKVCLEEIIKRNLPGICSLALCTISLIDP